MDNEYLLKRFEKCSIQVRAAIEDNIQIDFEIRGWNGRKTERPVFYIPCEICDRKIKSTVYFRDRNHVCDYCKGKIKKKKEALVISEEIINAKTKCDKRFEDAVNEIKRQVRDFDKYSNAIKIAQTRCEKYGSVPEAMVAIELLKLGYSIIPQQKIHSYKVDFVVRSKKWVIEVDGSAFHKDIDKDKKREIEILYALGFDWKIIRIPAEVVKENISGLNRMIYNYIKSID